ncbi:hypothetical protein [Bifidobacterium sp. A11]|uniref:hypothetical protein n=1 Tax=Bifidobacterium sp. A11 TaxID=1394176 RepID=UPI0004208A3D|nr:hypothetical protein [Bifidobacterium sp. A11]
MGSEQERTAWYFNTVTGIPEQGKLSPEDRRMGPYRSRQEALDAWKIAKRRNKEWDEEDRRWRQAWEGEPEQGQSSADR